MRTCSIPARTAGAHKRSEEHTSELQSQSNLVCRLLLEKKKNNEQLPFPTAYAKPLVTYRTESFNETATLLSPPPFSIQPHHSRGTFCTVSAAPAYQPDI